MLSGETKTKGQCGAGPERPHLFSEPQASSDLARPALPGGLQGTGRDRPVPGVTQETSVRERALSTWYLETGRAIGVN